MSTKVDFPEEILNTSAESALEQAQNADDAPALIEAWVERKNAAAVQELAERGQGKARKAARRGLNVLKSRGVPIPPRRKNKAGAADAEPKIEALMVPSDGSGTTMFVITKTSPGGRCIACFAYVHDALGVQRLERVDSTSGKIKAALNRGLTGGAGKPVAVPLLWARKRIADARKRHDELKTPEPLGFDSSKDLLEPVPETPTEHPFDTEGFAFAAEDAVALAADSGALHHLQEFASWLPTEAAMRDLLRGVGQRIAESNQASSKESDAESDQEQVSEHLKTEMLAVTDRYFGDEERARLVARMKDAALSVLARQGESDALKVAATIQAIEGCGLITNPPRDVPFLRAFFEKGVSLMMMQQGGQLQIPIPRTLPNTAASLDASSTLEAEATETDEATT